ncbi:MAG: small subunit ribosomal protein [Actinomycetota bacterium]|nr:small subunit ribosomal protein [Actinomycetota bacterium]
MATKIKLMRLGKMRAPYYRIVVADARTKRDGRSIETIGKYHPKEDPSFIQVDSERAQYWLGVGAQPTDAVAAIFRVTGDWQKFKGEPAPPPMLVAAPKADKKSVFEAAAREGIEGASGAATTPKKKAAPKKEATADAPTADDATAAEATTAEDAPAAEATADEPAAEATAEAPAAEAAADAPAADAAAAADAAPTEE